MKVNGFEIHAEPFVAHGTYACSNACGYEVQLNDSCDAARLRMPESGKITDWLEIEMVEDKEWSEASGYDHSRVVIDPEHYNVPLDLVMYIDDEEQPWTDPAGGVHYGDEDDPAAMYE